MAGSRHLILIVCDQRGGKPYHALCDLGSGRRGDDVRFCRIRAGYGLPAGAPLGAKMMPSVVVANPMRQLLRVALWGLVSFG